MHSGFSRGRYEGFSVTSPPYVPAHSPVPRHVTGTPSESINRANPRAFETGACPVKTAPGAVLEIFNSSRVGSKIQVLGGSTVLTSKRPGMPLSGVHLFGSDADDDDCCA